MDRYTYSEMLARELGGGAWFWLSLFLTLSFAAYVVRQLRERHERFSPVTLIAITLTLYCLGSTIRGALTWGQFFYETHDWSPQIWRATWPWFGTSVTLNSIGAFFSIWLLSPERHRCWYAIGSVIIAIAVPLALHFLI